MSDKGWAWLINHADALHVWRLGVLIQADTSRCNKMHLAAAWGIEWEWAGAPPLPNGVMRSRMRFRLGDVWIEAKSWDEDVKPTLVASRGAVTMSEAV